MTQAPWVLLISSRAGGLASSQGRSERHTTLQKSPSHGSACYRLSLGCLLSHEQPDANCWCCLAYEHQHATHGPICLTMLQAGTEVPTPHVSLSSKAKA